MVGSVVGEHERNGIAFRDVELRHGGEIFAVGLHRRAQRCHVGAGNGEHGAVLQSSYPRHVRAGAESQHELHSHLYRAGVAPNDADDVRGGAPGWHEVDQRDRAGIGLKRGLEDQRFASIAAFRFLDRVLRGDQPAPVIARAEQRCEACV